jgi:quercetin dioxygenase-like cupin family protein
VTDEQSQTPSTEQSLGGSSAATAPAADSSPPPGRVYYDEARQFLMVEGVIARGIPTFPLAPRPKRDARAAAFDALGGNTTLGIHLSEIAPGGQKKGHRHLDEATFYIVAGRGWTGLRQTDTETELQRIEWEAGDVLVIPANAWHEHHNTDPDRPALQLAFKNTRLLRKLFHSRAFVYQNDVRFDDRYDDEANYWALREAANHGKLRTNVIRAVVREPLSPDPEAGDGVSVGRYSMGGHRTLDHALVEIGIGGHVREHRHLAEEAMLILQGAGRTELRSDDGRRASFGWQAGDLIAPPLHVWRRHEQTGNLPVRYLLVRNNFIERALGIKGNLSFDSQLPDRFPSAIEADRD